MALEIERKFLVVSTEYERLAVNRVEISQGYLSRDPRRTVRVRLWRDKDESRGFITVKGINTGATRQEFEYEIPFDDALKLMILCDGIVEKVRFIVPYGGHKWEVDHFAGELEPLTLAEVELPSEDCPIELPPFIGVEVTGDPRYYNSNLVAQ